MNQHIIVPPPPPPGCDVIQIPVCGFTVEKEHANVRTNLMESIRNAGGYGQMSLKHVPEDVCHLPGKPKPPPQFMPTAGPMTSSMGGKVPGKNFAPGSAALMNDLNAALHQRQVKKEMRRGRGRGIGGSNPGQQQTIPVQTFNPQTDAEATNF